MNPRKKPPGKVSSIKGEFRPDVVTDDDYEVAVEAQSTVLRAQGIERKILGAIRSRLALGAADAGERWYFDSQLGIVRRRDGGRKTG